MSDFFSEEPEDVGVWGNVIDAREGEEDVIWRSARGSQDRGQEVKSDVTASSSEPIWPIIGTVTTPRGCVGIRSREAPWIDRLDDVGEEPENEGSKDRQEPDGPKEVAGVIYLDMVRIEGDDQPGMIEALGHGLGFEGEWSVFPL